MTPEERDELRREMQAAMKVALREVIAEALADADLERRVTERLYRQMSEHATKGISEWVGKRVVMVLLTAAMSGSIAWAVVTGRFK